MGRQTSCEGKGCLQHSTTSLWGQWELISAGWALALGWEDNSCYAQAVFLGISRHAGGCNRWCQLLCKVYMTNHFCGTLWGTTDNSEPPTVRAGLWLDYVDPNRSIIKCCASVEVALSQLWSATSKTVVMRSIICPVFLGVLVLWLCISRATHATFITSKEILH